MAEKIIDTTCIRKGLKKRLNVTQANKLVSKCAKKKKKITYRYALVDKKTGVVTSRFTSKKRAEKYKRKETRLLSIKHPDVKKYFKKIS